MEFNGCGVGESSKGERERDWERKGERERVKKGQIFRFTLGLIQFHPQRNHLMPYILFQWGFYGLT